jgi:biotin transport system substrate-specific component
MLTLQFVFSVLVIVASARIEIEVPAALAAYLPAALDVPITLQSLAVLTVAALLRAPYGAWAAAAYVFLGVAGAPVFADGRGGWEAAADESAGYLVGFVVGAIVVARMN